MNIEQSRLNLLQSVQDVHKQDIKTYISGHLNQSKLKLPEAEGRASHERWTSSSQPPVRLKPASHPVHKPVRKGQLSQASLRRKTMMNTVAEFSLGALGCYCSEPNDISSNDYKQGDSEAGMSYSSTGMTGNTLHSSTRRKNISRDIEKGVFVEELKLPEIMLSAKDKEGSYLQIKTAVPSKHHFVKSYLSQVTKEEQYGAMKDFEKTVMNVPDSNEQGLLTGDRIVRKLRKRLNKKLQPLNDPSRRGPNFHRLQAYSDCFTKIIEQSTTFSRLLKMIKDEYDSYLAYILDQNRVSQHQELYSQMPSLSKAKTVAESIQQQQNILQSLEIEVKHLLSENDSLRERVREENGRPISTTTSENIQESDMKTRIHVEDFPKDFQEQVEDLHSQIAEQLESLDKMKRYQREHCVPSSVCQHFEQCIKDTDVDIQKFLKQNEFLEQSIEELKQELDKLISSDGTSDENKTDYWKAIKISKMMDSPVSATNQNQSEPKGVD